MTVGAALDGASSRLRQAGIASARLDAERLLRHVLGWDAATLIVRDREPLSDSRRAEFERLIEARAERLPLQHLIGSQHFWRHEFRVTPDVLIPRPETEHLVEAALEWLSGRGRPVIADVGTGSGCIALSIAAERPDAIVHAIDLSPAALAIARDNANRLGLGSRVQFREGDLLAPLAGEPLDLILSNPPYVDAGEITTLAPEVRDHEPRLALVPPGDRFSIYGRLAREAADALQPGGVLMVEIGRGMEDGVLRLFEDVGLDIERVIPDLQSIARVVVAGRPGR